MGPLFGLTVVLALLALSILMVFTRGMRVWGIAGIVYTIILPIFGLRQATLLVGIGALAMIQVTSTRYERSKLPVAKSATQRGIAEDGKIRL